MKILIVEDEKKLRESLKTGLEEHGYEVELAADGYEGQKKVLSNTYNVIITDIIMPSQSGIQLLNTIRQNNIQTPVLVLTALTLMDEKIEVYEAGADDYLTKPFDFRELLVKLRALLKRSNATELPRQEILKYADVILNTLTKEVMRSNIPVYLTPKEFDLLSYFLLYPEKIISKNELLLNIWDLDFQTNTNVVEVYINFLRNKIEKDFPTKLIHTLSRVGYILKTED